MSLNFLEIILMNIWSWSSSSDREELRVGKSEGLSIGLAIGGIGGGYIYVAANGFS